jgi:release factor glutamine methyltransferase
VARPKPQPTTLAEALAEARRRIGNRAEARRLAALALDRSTGWIIAHPDAALSEETRARFARLVAQRAHGVPYAHLAGEREFYGRAFTVSPDVLIPRPETEHLVDWALSLPLSSDARVLDVGTGSGCVAWTLAAERPGWRVTATDVSREALAMAEINRDRMGLTNAALAAGDLLRPVAGRQFDLIVSNPPYVAGDDPHLDRGDLRFEPRVALTPGPDGLALIGRLIESAPEHLAAGGWLLLEHGYDQAADVRALLAGAGFIDVESRPDLAGIERVSGGRVKG